MNEWNWFCFDCKWKGNNPTGNCDSYLSDKSIKRWHAWRKGDKGIDLKPSKLWKENGNAQGKEDTITFSAKRQFAQEDDRYTWKIGDTKELYVRFISYKFKNNWKN